MNKRWNLSTEEERIVVLLGKKKKLFFKIIFHSKLINDSLQMNQNFKELFLFNQSNIVLL